MHYTTIYNSPLGEILLACDDIGLTGLWFKDQKYYAAGLSRETSPLEHPLLSNAKYWLDAYFAKQKPDFLPKLHLNGTPFQMEVWGILCTIPYGNTMTYGEIAAILAQNRGLSSMSAQAVGNAVGHNPVSIIVPCHRVIGTNGKLTGYAGGIEKKEALLTLEKSSFLSFHSHT